MKFNSKLIFLVLFLITFPWEGCNNTNPTSSSYTPPPAIDTEALVVFQGSPVSVVVNPHVYTSSGVPVTPSSFEPATVKYFPVSILVPFPTPSALPMSLVQGPGAGQCTSAPCTLSPVFGYDTIVTGGLPGNNPYGILITGEMNDPENVAYYPGPGNFDSIEFGWFPNGVGNPPDFDLSPFQGIEFYINVSSVDNVVDRLFQVLCAQNNNGTGADCNSTPAERPDLVHCFDAYQYDYTDIARDQWVFVQKRWGDLKQFGNGSPPSPATLSGVNLQQFQTLAWVESNAAAAGPMTVNFQLTGMRFF